MGWNMAGLSKKLAAKIAALTVATVGLSGCVYDLGVGYYDDGYAYNRYDCDPFAPFDSYYACDSGYGFYNIGFGGGWYDSFWYPGYGYYIFDNRGHRHHMRDHHRRYWASRRHEWYREHRGRGRGRGHDGDDRRGHGYGYNDGSRDRVVDRPIGWPEQGGGRRSARPGREPEATPSPPLGREDDRLGRRRDGADVLRANDGRRDGAGRRRDGLRPDAGAQPAAAAPVPQLTARPPRGGSGEGRRGEGRGGGRWQQPSGDAAPQAGTYQPPAAPRAQQSVPQTAPQVTPPPPRPARVPRETPPSRQRDFSGARD